MKDEIENVTRLMKEVARIRGVWESRGGMKSSTELLRDVEDDMSMIREIMDY